MKCTHPQGSGKTSEKIRDMKVHEYHREDK